MLMLWTSDTAHAQLFHMLLPAKDCAATQLAALLAYLSHMIDQAASVCAMPAPAQTVVYDGNCHVGSAPAVHDVQPLLCEDVTLQAGRWSAQMDRSAQRRCGCADEERAAVMCSCWWE